MAAFTLGIPLEMVTVKPTTDFIAPNGFPTGGSQTSQAVAYVRESYFFGNVIWHLLVLTFNLFCFPGGHEGVRGAAETHPAG